MSENEKSSVIVLQDDQDKKEKKWTLDKYGRGIKNHKWWVIGSTVVTAVVGTVVLEFGLNRARECFSANYVYNLATKIGDDNIERYLDGQAFDANAVLNINVLKAVKESDEDFAKIDVEKISKDGGISIIKESTYDKDENDKIIASTKSTTYTINAKTRYFPSNAVGRKFVESLILYPKNISTEAINNFDVTNYIVDGGANVEYTKQVGGLVKQYSEIQKTYKELSDKFGIATLVSPSGDKIGQVISDFTNKYAAGAASSVDVLSGSLYARHYVNYTEGKEAEKINELHLTSKSYAEVLGRKENELKVAKDELESLTSIVSLKTTDDEDPIFKRISEVNTEIKELSEDVADITKELNLNGYYLKGSSWEFDDTKESTIKCLQTLDPSWVNDCKSFANQLKAATNNLRGDVDSATSRCRYVYSTCQNNVTILDSGTISIKNNINGAIGAIVGALLGFVVSTFICTALVIYKKED